MKTLIGVVIMILFCPALCLSQNDPGDPPPPETTDCNTSGHTAEIGINGVLIKVFGKTKAEAKARAKTVCHDKITADNGSKVDQLSGAPFACDVCEEGWEGCELQISDIYRTEKNEEGKEIKKPFDPWMDGPFTDPATQKDYWKVKCPAGKWKVDFGCSECEESEESEDPKKDQ